MNFNMNTIYTHILSHINNKLQDLCSLWINTINHSIQASKQTIISIGDKAIWCIMMATIPISPVTVSILSEQSTSILLHPMTITRTPHPDKSNSSDLLYKEYFVILSRVGDTAIWWIMMATISVSLVTSSINSEQSTPIVLQPVTITRTPDTDKSNLSSLQYNYSCLTDILDECLAFICLCHCCTNHINTVLL